LFDGVWQMEKIMEIIGVSKSYGVVKALDDVSIDLYKGKIHGLVGTNGSGKSTLLNILLGNSIISESGGYEGEVKLRGKKINPFKHKYKGELGMIHQEFILIEGMTVWENVNIGHEITSKKTTKYLGNELSYILKYENKIQVEKILKELEIDIDLDLKVENLSTNIKQFIEIAREIKRKDLKILFLDEPTASLNKVDSGILMKILVSLAKKGLTIVFISHRLDEVAKLCDYVTVIRDGKLISNHKREELDIKIMGKQMTGYDVEQSSVHKRIVQGEKILELIDYSVALPGDESKNINLCITEGEIIGITSLSGHGKLSLGHGIGGLIESKGKVKYYGKEIELDRKNISKNIKKGIIVLTEDRKNINLLMDQSIEENIAFTAALTKGNFMKKGILGRLGFRDNKKIKRYSKDCIATYDIKASSSKQRLKELSGGNQQKVCIARAVALDPKLLFVGEPTRGIDVAAKEKVLQTLVDLNREKNTTIVIASSEVDELERICDRIIVLEKGSIVNTISPCKRSRGKGLVEYA